MEEVMEFQELKRVRTLNRSLEPWLALKKFPLSVFNNLNEVMTYMGLSSQTICVLYFRKQKGLFHIFPSSSFPYASLENELHTNHSKENFHRGHNTS